MSESTRIDGDGGGGGGFYVTTGVELRMHDFWEEKGTWRRNPYDVPYCVDVHIVRTVHAPTVRKLRIHVCI